LFDLLDAFRGEGVFNQYRDCDPALDCPDGPAIRRQNLLQYLNVFAGARYLLIGEAAGYAGCRFSGIPFTGEAQIAGPGCLPWARALGLQQSSTGGPWRERSGQIVWEAFRGRRDCVLWNAFPWHPHGDKSLSNRKPRSSELLECTDVLQCAVSLFPLAQICAIGRVSESKLRDIGIEASYIRHPSHGGKRAFTEGVTSLPRADQGESDV
jgi:uracil-DNA glycosylase